MPLKQAFDLTKERRTIAQPNAGFIIQLIAFERVIFGTTSRLGDLINKKAEVNEEDGTQKSEQAVDKEIADGIEMLKISGDEEAAKELQNEI